MKFFSIFEEQNKVQDDDWGLKYSKAYEFIGNEVKKSPVTLFFDARDLGFDLHKTREESKSLVEDFDDLMKKIDRGIEEKSLVVDTAIEADAGGGGVEDLIPSFSTIIQTAFVFVILQSTTGFFQEAGKDFYVWIKNKIKKVKYKKGKHVYVIIRGKKKEAKFLFQSSFSEETFENAWKEMLKFNVDELDIEEYEERIYVFDTKENRWVIFY